MELSQEDRHCHYILMKRKQPLQPAHQMIFLFELLHKRTDILVSKDFGNNRQPANKKQKEFYCHRLVLYTQVSYLFQ